MISFSSVSLFEDLIPSDPRISRCLRSGLLFKKRFVLEFFIVDCERPAMSADSDGVCVVFLAILASCFLDHGLKFNAAAGSVIDFVGFETWAMSVATLICNLVCASEGVGDEFNQDISDAESGVG